jgi:hypothetical protein
MRERLDGELADMHEEVQDLQSLYDAVDDLERHVDELEDFRDRLRSTFGNPGE